MIAGKGARACAGFLRDPVDSVERCAACRLQEEAARVAF